MTKGKCEICEHVTNDVPPYGDWECESCGQQYAYDEGHKIILTEDQIIVLRKLISENRRTNER